VLYSGRNCLPPNYSPKTPSLRYRFRGVLRLSHGPLNDIVGAAPSRYPLQTWPVKSSTGEGAGVLDAWGIRWTDQPIANRVVGRLSQAGPGPFPTACTQHRAPPLPQVSTMEVRPQRPKGRDGALSSLNIAIEAMNLAKEVSSITPAKAVFGSVSILLTMVRVRFPVSYDQMSHVHVRPGFYGQQTRLCRARPSLRRRV